MPRLVVYFAAADTVIFLPQSRISHDPSRSIPFDTRIEPIAFSSCAHSCVLYPFFSIGRVARVNPPSLPSEPQLVDCKIDVIKWYTYSCTEEADPFPRESTDRRHFLPVGKTLIVLRVVLVFFSSQLRCASRAHPAGNGNEIHRAISRAVGLLTEHLRAVIKSTAALCIESISQGLRLRLAGCAYTNCLFKQLSRYCVGSIALRIKLVDFSLSESSSNRRARSLYCIKNTT